jgi:hypothetical protein
VVKELVAAAREQGIRFRAYLDDWLILAGHRLQCHRDTQKVLELADQLGFAVNWDESELTPARSFKYLGMQIDSVQWLVRPSDDRVQRLLSKLRELRSAAVASARALAALLGHFESLVPLVPLAGVYKRPLQRGFQDRGDHAASPWETLIPLGAWFLEATDQCWMRPG